MDNFGVCKYKEDADEWLAENECFWIYHYSHNIMKYADQVYCCDHSSKNRPGHFQCKANMRIRYRKDLSALSVAFIQTTREPDH
uniref:Uncharacterized protein n=1 Tax=Ditylenchus dipsaci TaxID=166011 RepID=A0A915D5Y8_9BILA